MIKKLIINTPQGKSGILTKESRFSFSYSDGDRNKEISLMMPIRSESYSSTNLLPVFESYRPEGFLLEKLTKRLLKFGRVDDMQILSVVGDNGIGRLKFSKEGTENTKENKAPSIKEILKSGRSQELFDHLVDVYIGSGISGVQPKVLIPEILSGAIIQPSVIVKATPIEYPNLSKNEFLCMAVAKVANLDVPDEFWLSDDGLLFVVSRFDIIKKDDKFIQLGFEDLCQLMGKTSIGKYEGSYENVVKALHLYCGENSASATSKFFWYLVASILMRNGDAHLKNFGLLYENPRISKPYISPLYDVTTTSIYSIGGSGFKDQTMSLKLSGDHRYPSKDALIRFGREKCHVSNPESVITEISESMIHCAKEYCDIFDKKFASKFFSEWRDSLKTFGIRWDY